MEWKLNLLLAFFFIFPLDLQFRQCFIIAFLRVLVIGAMGQKLTFPIYYREGLNGQVFILCGSMSVKKAGLSWPSPGVPEPRPLEEADTFLELTWPRPDCCGCGGNCIHENDRSKRKFYYPTLVPVTQAFIWTVYTKECQAFLTCDWTIIMYVKFTFVFGVLYSTLGVSIFSIVFFGLLVFGMIQHHKTDVSKRQLPSTVGLLFSVQ